MFWGHWKHKNDSKIKLIQYQNIIDKTEKVCAERNDDELERKLGRDFDKRPAYKAKYHIKCYVTYISKKRKAISESSVHHVAFIKLINEVEQELLVGRAITVKPLLFRFKESLQQGNCENFNPYCWKIWKA